MKNRTLRQETLEIYQMLQARSQARNRRINDVVQKCKRKRAEVNNNRLTRITIEKEQKFNGDIEKAQSTGRDRESRRYKTILKNNMLCKQNELRELFYTSPDTRADTSTISTRVLINELDTNS